MTLTFRMPLPLNLANARLHWAVKDKARKAYLAHCDLLQSGGILPPPPAVPLQKATLAVAMTLGNAMDDDNAIARIKWAQDWLVSRGYIAGDSRKHLKLTGLPTQRISRKNEPCLELTLEAA